MSVLAIDLAPSSVKTRGCANCGETLHVLASSAPKRSLLQSQGSGGTWKDDYFFAEVQALPQDFMMGNYYCSTHPQSPFMQQRIVALQTAQGRITLTGNVLKTFEGDQVQEQQLQDDEVPAALQQHFGIAQQQA